MATYKSFVIQSVQELRQSAHQWDDLWLRSDVSSPIARAELVAQWVEFYAPGADFKAIVVGTHDHFWAAIPIVQTTQAKLIPTGNLASNHNLPGGELLVDANCDRAEVLSVLAKSVRHCPWPLLWFDLVPYETAAWQAFQASLSHLGAIVTCEPRYQVGEIEIATDWPSECGRWSSNFRKQIHKSIRRLEQAGTLELKIHREFALADVEPLLKRGFEVEDRSWKGKEGTSVLRSGMYDLLVRQAQQLAQWNQLEIAFLELSGHPIAFEYAWTGKNVYHSYKVGYDDEFATHSPGQLLVYFLMQRFFRDQTYRRIDCLGPLSSAIERFRPNRRSVGRLIFAPSGVVGTALHALYRNLVPVARRIRNRYRSSTEETEKNEVMAATCAG